MTDSPSGPVDGSPTGRPTHSSPRGVRSRTAWRRRRVLRTLDLVKGAVLGAVITIGATAHVSAEPAAPPVVAAPEDTRLARLLDDHRCSTTGFADGTIPASSIIRTPQGELRVTSFDRGWATHTGQRPGELVAVCLDPR